MVKPETNSRHVSSGSTLETTSRAISGSSVCFELGFVPAEASEREPPDLPPLVWQALYALLCDERSEPPPPSWPFGHRWSLPIILINSHHFEIFWIIDY
jgi:hypothetical protein